MRTALLLLFLLALAAVPGSLLPQRSVDPARVAQFAEQHPTLAPWSTGSRCSTSTRSPWFAAIYLLLFVSLVGCVVPRSRLHLAAVRGPAAARAAQPRPAAGRTTRRRPTAAPTRCSTRARAALRGRRFRVDVADGSVAAEKGYLRETGNLVFHLALLLPARRRRRSGTCSATRATSWSSRATASPTPSRPTTPGPPGPLARRGLAARRSRVDADEPDGALPARRARRRGAPRDFEAHVRYTADPDAPEQRYDLRVNHPLDVDGAKVYLLGNGYAPVFTVRDSNGEVVFAGPVPFLPQDGEQHLDRRRQGARRAAAAARLRRALPAHRGHRRRARSALGLPGARAAARAARRVYQGDLGLDGGTPQSVYSPADRTG